MALTLAVARMEKARRSYPHTIVKVYRHEELCLYSSGTCIPVYPCTCGKAKHVGYTLVLGRHATN